MNTKNLALQNLLISDDKEEIYNCVFPAVRFVVSMRLRGCPVQDIEDITSDVIVKLFDNDCAALRGIREPSKFHSWLVTVTINATRDYFRRRKITISLDSEINDNGRTLHDVLSGAVPDPMDTLEWEEIHSRVWKAVDSLKGIYKKVIKDKFWFNLSVPEIVARRGIAEMTVYVRFMRAFAMLRPQLEEFRDPAVR